jgi:hypothetical protein
MVAHHAWLLGTPMVSREFRNSAVSIGRLYCACIVTCEGWGMGGCTVAI